MTKTEKRKVLVVGMGATGLSCVRYLNEMGDDITVIDSRDVPPGLRQLKEEFPEVDVITGTLDSPVYRDMDMLVVSPGVSIRTPAILQAAEKGIEIVGDIELFSRCVNETGAKVIAVTGSNGKSTVTTLAENFCSAAGLDSRVGGNIGKPALELLQEPLADIYVLELSSFQLETTYSLATTSAVVLNISEDHMDRYHDIDDYARAKSVIYRNCEHIVVNREDVLASSLANRSENVVSFGYSNPENDQDYGISTDNKFIVRGSKKILALDSIRLIGKHNVVNTMAAMALVEPLGVSSDVVAKVMASFTGLPHRSQVVAEANNVTWVNDSKATNVGACIAALEGIGRPVILIAGGEGKDADFSPLAMAIGKYVKHLVLIGRDASLIEEHIGADISRTHASSMEQAVEIAMANADENDVVLLSPACASFDMFDNFEHRGDVFIKAVHKLVHGGKQ